MAVQHSASNADGSPVPPNASLIVPMMSGEAFPQKILDIGSHAHEPSKVPMAGLITAVAMDGEVIAGLTADGHCKVHRRISSVRATGPARALRPDITTD